MKPNEVANALSFREFGRLCKLIDKKSPDGPMVWVNGQQIRQAGRLREHKFDVLRVKRDMQRIRVLIYTGGGFGKTRWCELRNN